MQLQLKTILNRIQHFVGFVYQEITLWENRKGRPRSIEILLAAHLGIRRRCSRCEQPAPGYDRLDQRRWLFVPLWGIPTYFLYARGGSNVPSMGWWWNTFPGTSGSDP